MEQAVSKNVMSANKQKNKECFISDIPQRTLSAFQMGSRPSDRILFHNCTNHPARIADSHRVVRNIFNNNTAAANHNIASDRNPRHDMNARSDPNIAAHRDGIRIFQSLVAPLGINGVSCRVEAAVRCNKHIVTEGDLQQGSGRTGQAKNKNARICKELHHIHRKVFPLRPDRCPHLWQLRYPLSPRDMVKKWYQAHRVALYQPTGLRQEILQRFPHHYGGQAAGSNRSSSQQVQQAG